MEWSGKIRRILQLFCVTFMVMIVSAENVYPQISKLLDIIKDLPQDTSRVNAINYWIARNCRGHSEACMPYQEEALSLSRQFNYANGFAWAYFNKGGMYRVAGLTDSSLYYLELSNHLFDSLGQKRDQAPVLNELGIVLRNTGRIEDAVKAHGMAADYYLASGDTLRMAMALNNQASAHGRAGRDSLESAIRIEALKIARSYGQERLEASIAMNIVNKFLVSGKTEKALSLYRELREVYRKDGDNARIADIQTAMAVAYTRQGDYVSALKLQFENLELLKGFDDMSRLADQLSNIGDNYAALNETKRAFDYHKQANVLYDSLQLELKHAFSYVELSEDMAELDSLDAALYYAKAAIAKVPAEENNCSKTKPLLALADVYNKASETDLATRYYKETYNLSVDCELDIERAESAAQLGKLMLVQEPAEAEKFLLKAYETALSIKKTVLRKTVAESLSDLYQGRGEYRKALQYYREFHTLNDSLFSQQKLRQFSMLEAESKFEKDKSKLVFDQEREKFVLEEEKKSANLKFLAATVIAFILLIAGVLIFRANRSKTAINSRLEQANNKLQQLDQFKSRLFANINHDIRTPLTLIQGYASRIETNQDNYLTSVSEEDLLHLQRNVLVLTEMTNEIQDLLLLEEKKLKITYHRVEIGAYLSRMVKMFNSLAELSKTNLSYTSDVSEGLIVHLDERHFEKIFYNLISNAFRYTPSGGRIYVRLNNDYDNIIIKIADTGRGISPDDLPNIFDRFYQSPMNEFRSKEGFGIGLAVVKELIHLHGGEINVESKEGVGTTFAVRLPYNLDKEISRSEPVAQDLIENHPARRARDTMISTKNQDIKTVLIVDDHEEIRKYIAGIVSGEYDVKEAADGKQALKILEKNHADLIITDLMMPWLDGYDLIDRVKKSDDKNKIPIMVVSARTTEEDKHKVLDAGINEFISKPFDPNELKKRIRNILENSNAGIENQWADVIGNKKTLSAIEQNVLKKLNQIITDNIGNPDLNTDLIAMELSASRSKAIRLIKTLTDKTPLEYIKSTRLNYVDTLIRNKHVKNATEAAAAIGMKHVTHFSKQYKIHFGKLPEFPS